MERQKGRTDGEAEVCGGEKRERENNSLII